MQNPRLRARLEAATPWLGIGFKQVMNGPNIKGVLVESVVAGSPAESAGVLKGDIVTHINGKSITSPSEFLRLVAELRINVDYPLTVLRNDKTIELTIRPAVHPRGRFGSALPPDVSEISDKPEPRKGFLDINVLKYVFIDPKTHVVTFVGKYDPAYNTGPIPYADYLKVALENPYPSFSLDPPQETIESLKVAAKVIDAEIAKLDSLEYSNQWTQNVANLLINDTSLQADSKRFFKHCAEVMGITGDELKRMHDAATGKIDIPGTEFMGLAAKMIRGVGLTKAGDALGVLAEGGTPEELLYKMAEKLGLSSQYYELASKNLSPEEFRKEEIILCISEICRHLEAPESEINSIIASIRGGQSANLIINYMGKQISTFITNKLGRKMINGLILGPELLSKIYNLPIPKAELVFKDLPADSLLGDVFFKSDYRLKDLCTFPDARDKVPAHLTHQEFMQKETTANANKVLRNLDFLAGQRLVPAEVAMTVSPARDIVFFGDSRIKIVGWIIEMMRPADKVTADVLSEYISKYSSFLTEHYDEYS
ncbi:MAG: PDZ domain-containing protein, partial [Armatimonadota bacterium]|nr:PDZ domain-containing protein [Armatimonadota bacterium]